MVDVIRRRVLLVGALACAMLITSSCDGTPGPVGTSSAPLFANEAEAFAAAEETYRAYVDAGNAIDLAEPATFEAALALTSGELNASERKSLTQMHADGWEVSGATDLVWFEGDEFDSEHLFAHACIDVSSIGLVDAQGVSQVQPDRRDRYAVDLTFVETSSAPQQLTIAKSTAVEDDRCVIG